MHDVLRLGGPEGRRQRVAEYVEEDTLRLGVSSVVLRLQLLHDFEGVRARFVLVDNGVAQTGRRSSLHPYLPQQYIRLVHPFSNRSFYESSTAIYRRRA